MLTGKQKRYLRKEAHHLEPIFQVGKYGITDNFIQQIDEALERRELFKITLLQNTDEEINDVANMLHEATKAEVVQIIGRIIVLYRPSQQKKYQKYSQEVYKIRQKQA